jgi:hypothetical protein
MFEGIRKGIRRTRGGQVRIAEEVPEVGER